MKYKIIITETLARTVEVEAEDEYEALEKVEFMYYNGLEILDSSDFLAVDFDFGNNPDE